MRLEFESSIWTRGDWTFFHTYILFGILNNGFSAIYRCQNCKILSKIETLNKVHESWNCRKYAIFIFSFLNDDIFELTMAIWQESTPCMFFFQHFPYITFKKCLWWCKRCFFVENVSFISISLTVKKKVTLWKIKENPGPKTRRSNIWVFRTILRSTVFPPDEHSIYLFCSVIALSFYTYLLCY